MNRLLFFIYCLVAVIIIGSQTACNKESIITSKDALLRLSEDTLHFDTVFTSRGSATQFFKIYNPNREKLILQSVQLKGGASSFFRMNIDGISGTQINNIEIAANDSIYGFVTVTINPNSNTLPFLVSDSIEINYNGNSRLLQLEAYGQNAHFLRNKIIAADTTFTNQLPIVLLGPLTINQSATLTINAGTKIYCNANSAILVNGRLLANGQSADSLRIQFSGNRLDEPYRNYPGSWPGIYFNATSNNSVLSYCNIINSYQGVIVQEPASIANSTKLTMQQCKLDNIFDIAIGGVNSSITANNCLVSNCGNNILIVSGGRYNFNNCTFVSINNSFVEHKNPVAIFSNTNSSGNTNAFTGTINNSIIYGEGGLVEDELITQRNAAASFSLQVNNSLYKVKNDIPIANATITQSIKNEKPLFDSIDIGKRFFNFRLASNSPCINKGQPTNLTFDLDGKPRTVGILPDMGCYEKQ
jgi:hypothetical protein